MVTLVERFEAAAQSEPSRQYLRNLALIVETHDSQPYHPTIESAALVADNAIRSSTPKDGWVSVERTMQAVVSSFWGLDTETLPEALRDFARGGRVMDLGCGRSGFLRYFAGTSETVAVDLRTDYLQFQQDQLRQVGHLAHRGFRAAASDMRDIPTGSIDLLSGNNSSPRWETKPEGAANSFREQFRVLRRGGIDMVNPIIGSFNYLHISWENYLADWSVSPVDPNLSHELGLPRAIHSHIFAAFIREMLQAEAAGDIRLALFRPGEPESDSDRVSRTPLRYQVGNVAMFQKTS